MKCAYPACVYKEKSNQYAIVFPDLDNLATCGETLEKAMEMATDCLAGYIYSLEIEGEAIPKASDIKDISLDIYDEMVEGYVSIIFVDVDEYAKNHFNKAIKKTLTIPEWLNDIAIRKNVNFSKVLQKALIQELNIQTKK